MNLGLYEQLGGAGGAVLGGKVLGAAGNLLSQGFDALDAPGALLRSGIGSALGAQATGDNTYLGNVHTGRDLLQGLGVVGMDDQQFGWDDLGGMGVEAVLDPVGLLTGAIGAKAGHTLGKQAGRAYGMERAFQKAGSALDAAEAAKPKFGTLSDLGMPLAGEVESMGAGNWPEPMMAGQMMGLRDMPKMPPMSQYGAPLDDKVRRLAMMQEAFAKDPSARAAVDRALARRRQELITGTPPESPPLTYPEFSQMRDEGAVAGATSDWFSGDELDSIRSGSIDNGSWDSGLDEIRPLPPDVPADMGPLTLDQQAFMAGDTFNELPLTHAKQIRRMLPNPMTPVDRAADTFDMVKQPFDYPDGVPGGFDPGATAIIDRGGNDLVPPGSPHVYADPGGMTLHDVLAGGDTGEFTDQINLRPAWQQMGATAQDAERLAQAERLRRIADLDTKDLMQLPGGDVTQALPGSPAVRRAMDQRMIEQAGQPDSMSWLLPEGQPNPYGRPGANPDPYVPQYSPDVPRMDPNPTPYGGIPGAPTDAQYAQMDEDFARLGHLGDRIQGEGLHDLNRIANDQAPMEGLIPRHIREQLARDGDVVRAWTEMPHDMSSMDIQFPRTPGTQVTTSGLGPAGVFNEVAAGGLDPFDALLRTAPPGGGGGGENDALRRLFGQIEGGQNPADAYAARQLQQALGGAYRMTPEQEQQIVAFLRQVAPGGQIPPRLDWGTLDDMQFQDWLSERGIQPGTIPNPPRRPPGT